MAIESRTAFKVNSNNPTSESASAGQDNSDPFSLVEPPTVMNVTAAFMDMPKGCLWTVHPHKKIIVNQENSTLHYGRFGRILLRKSLKRAVQESQIYLLNI